MKKLVFLTLLMINFSLLSSEKSDCLKYRTVKEATLAETGIRLTFTTRDLNGTDFVETIFTLGKNKDTQLFEHIGDSNDRIGHEGNIDKLVQLSSVHARNVALLLISQIQDHRLYSPYAIFINPHSMTSKVPMLTLTPPVSQDKSDKKENGSDDKTKK